MCMAVCAVLSVLWPLYGKQLYLLFVRIAFFHSCNIYCVYPICLIGYAAVNQIECALSKISVFSFGLLLLIVSVLACFFSLALQICCEPGSRGDQVTGPVCEERIN